MASIKDLKKRIGTVKNTQQTTKAMKMVSAAKLRRAVEAIQNQRPYAKRIGGLLELLSSLPDAKIDSPLVKTEGEQTVGGRKLLLMVVTSDRGLCGGFNGNLLKTVQRWVKANQENYESIEFAFVGRRGNDFF